MEVDHNFVWRGGMASNFRLFVSGVLFKVGRGALRRLARLLLQAHLDADVLKHLEDCMRLSAHCKER
jgi:hypothetical protein